MKPEDFKKKSNLGIFLSYFRNHRGLFFIDICSAVIISAVDLAFPLISRQALYKMLPDPKLHQLFFITMGALFVSYILRAFLQFVIAYWGHTFGIRVEA